MPVTIRHRTEKMATTERPEGLAEFEHEVRARMSERHLLDILKNAEHWARFTRHFGPPSGSDPKLAEAVQRYLFAVFGRDDASLSGRPSRPVQRSG